MNALEQQLIDKVITGLHEFEVKVTQEIAQIRGEIHAMRDKNEADHKALCHLVEKSIKTETERLNKHSSEIDDNRERVAKLEAWKEQFQKQIANRIAVSQSVTAVAAVIIAFLLSKFL